MSNGTPVNVYSTAASGFLQHLIRAGVLRKERHRTFLRIHGYHTRSSIVQRESKFAALSLYRYFDAIVGEVQVIREERVRWPPISPICEWTYGVSEAVTNVGV